MARLLALSRYLVIIPVISSLIGAAMLMLYGGVLTIANSVQTINLMLQANEKGLKSEALQFIEIVDVFLLATVLYIIGVGLYELFIGKLDMPEWLVITSLDDLKVKLINVVVTVLAVLFLGEVVSWDGVSDLLPFGASVAVVIAALTLFLSQQARNSKGKKVGSEYDGAAGSSSEDAAKPNN